MTGMKKYLVLTFSLFVLAAYGQNENLVEEKIDKLILQMTLQEKVGQMNQLTGMKLSKNMKDAVRSGTVGTILNELDVNIINELQRIAVEESRLHIPLIIARDVIHGFKTIFPIPLGQAASWNPQVAEDGARVAALESSATGIRWTFAPMIDISRDPRWGRIAESCGEDPYLTSVMGVAMIKGFQGDDLSQPGSIAACAKHFAAYGASESGKDYNTTWVPELLLREVYLPPFEAAAKSGAATFMCSFNDINGIPSSGNEYLNYQILRKEWGYDGVLVSDWGSIQQMITHGFCTDLKDAAMKAANAAVDIDMMGYAYSKHLEGLVKDNQVREELVDKAVRNILRLKFRLGLFDNPYTEVRKDMPYYTAGALEKAKNAAIEGTVLLKNNGVLPLVNTIKKVAVIGPLSDSPVDQIGTWCFDAEPEHCITPLAAIRETYGEKIEVLAEKGLAYSRDKDGNGIKKAIEVARQADVILAFVGEEAILSGEARCRADISLPGIQTELIRALKETGKPVVMIVMSGRPLTISEEVDLSDAVLLAFHGGTMAGPALADLIWGEAIPSGKLPVTIPRMVGQVPIYYAHKKTGRPANNITLINDIEVGAKQTSIGFTSYHLDAGDTPLFPFGYGLSYTSFNYGHVTLSSVQMSMDDTLIVSCNITNTGKYDASEVVQLYIRDKVASLIRPVRELKGFEKVFIKAGETQTVTFQVTTSDLAYWNGKLEKKAEAGEFTVWISKDSQSGDGVDFVLK